MRLATIEPRSRSMRGRAFRTLTALLAVTICIGCVVPVGLLPQPSARQPDATAPIQVFRLTTPEGLFCSAFSAGNGAVVTAAHCIGASRSGTLTDARGGPAIRVGNARVNPVWEMSRTFGTDAAVLASQWQGLAGTGIPFLSRPLVAGEVLTLMTPSSGERDCPVLGQSGPWIELACRVDDGWSGAPLILRSSNGAAIAGILSGRGNYDGQRGLAEASHASAVAALLSL